MSAQPLNSDISVFQRVRAYRQMNRHETVEAITKRLRSLVMSVPAKEQLTLALTRDSATKGVTPYDEAGRPIVVGLRSIVTYSKAQETMPSVNFGVKIGGDIFIENDATTAGLARDLQKDLRALVTSG